LIFIGKIIKVRGNKGEVVVTPSPHLEEYGLSPGEVVVLQSIKYKREKKVDYIKEIKGNPVFKFCDTNTINEAFGLVGYSIYATPTDGQENKDRTLVNYLVKDAEGLVWGSIKAIDSSGFNPLLEVATPEGEMIYVPFVDEIVKEIDEETKILHINPPGGLKDLNKT
jgi:16S rRNA processing protein RimM